MENKNINPHLIRTDAKRSVKMKTKSKKSMNASFKNMAVALIISRLLSLYKLSNGHCRIV